MRWKTKKPRAHPPVVVRFESAYADLLEKSISASLRKQNQFTIMRPSMPIYEHVRQNNSGRHSIVFHGHQPPSQYINAIIIVETPSFVNLNNPAYLFFGSGYFVMRGSRNASLTGLCSLRSIKVKGMATMTSTMPIMNTSWIDLESAKSAA